MLICSDVMMTRIESLMTHMCGTLDGLMEYWYIRWSNGLLVH